MDLAWFPRMRRGACGQLRRCTGENAHIVDFYLCLSATFVTIRSP
ncbi:hypothetical protein [Frankia gtarii]|nr:hypothetical protein [Frankia gtarii]